MRAVIDRDEVLRLTRLARLKLGEDEIEPLARELSAILDHVGAAVDNDLGASTTSHVVEITNALRPDEPRASVCHARCGVAPSRQPSVATVFRYRARRRESYGDHRSVRRGGGAGDRDGRAVGGRAVQPAYRARAADDELNCFTWVVPEGSVDRRRAVTRRGMLPRQTHRWRACRWQSRMSYHEGVPSQ